MLAAGPAPEGSLDDMVLRERRTPETGPAEEQLMLVENGFPAFAELQKQVLRHFRQAGNVHWGDATDVKALCAQMNVGILMFCDVPMNLPGEGCACL